MLVHRTAELAPGLVREILLTLATERLPSSARAASWVARVSDVGLGEPSSTSPPCSKEGARGNLRSHVQTRYRQGRAAALRRPHGALLPTLDDIIDRVRDVAGADFAFILTRRGRLVTHHAPENMPEKGRLDLVNAAEQVLGTDGVTIRTMPRESLVPYGGAAPIDVYLAAREAAVLCVVMATWADTSRVSAAFEQGLNDVDELIEGEVEKRSQKSELRRRRRALPSSLPPDAEAGLARKAIWGARVPKPTLLGLEDQVAPQGRAPSTSQLPAVIADPESRPVASAVSRSPMRAFGALSAKSARPPAPADANARAPSSRPAAGAAGKIPAAPKSSRPARPRTQRPPPMRKPTPGRGTMPFIPGAAPAPRAIPADPPSAPEVTVSIANIGHKTLAVIELDAVAPDITLGTATVGRNTMAAIDLASVPSGRASGSAPEIRVGLATMPEIKREDLDVPDRATLPFTEPATDAKRRYDAVAPQPLHAPQGPQLTPDVRVRLTDLDFETTSALKQEERANELERDAREARKEAEAEARSRRNSNVEVWREALTELVTDEAKATRRRPRK